MHGAVSGTIGLIVGIRTEAVAAVRGASYSSGMTDKLTGIDEMSTYERKAWTVMIESAMDSAESTRRSRAVAATKSQARRVGQGAKAGLKKVPGGAFVADGFDSSVQQAMEGLHSVTVDRGLNSVKLANVIKAFEAEGAKIGGYDDIQAIDLRFCDRSLPRKKEAYLFLGTTEGVASSLAVTGAMVSATVSGGTTAAVAIGAIAADVTTVLVGMGRIVAIVAAHYGYDVREPDEQVYAAGVLAYSSAGSAGEKAASLASLSRLTQAMMRRATWKQLNNHKLVNVVQGVFSALGLKLTHKKLAQVIPVAGAIINGGMNAHFVNQTFTRAQHVYRLRYLTEKYGMNPADWAPDTAEADEPDGRPMPLVDEMLGIGIVDENGA